MADSDEQGQGSDLKRQFTDKVAVVTGASSGLGLAVSRALAAEGAIVVRASRSRSRLEESTAAVQQAAASPTHAVQCDVTQRDQVERLFAETVSRFGHVDILVNNAGSGMVAPFEFVQVDDAVDMFATNFWGAFHCIQAVLPHMKRQQSGCIVNISSVGGLRGIPNISLYSASKAALIALSDALRIEVKPCGIQVVTVCPGRMGDTLFFQNLKRYGPLKLYEELRTLSTDEVARALIKAMSKGKPMLILPLQARLWYGVNKILPRLVDHVLYTKMPSLKKEKVLDRSCLL